MSIWVWPSFLSIGFSLVLILALFRKRAAAPLLIRLVPVMVAVVWIQGAHWLGLAFPDNLLWWKQLSLLGELALPVTVGYVSHSLLKDFSSTLEGVVSGWWKMIAGGSAVLGLVVLGAPDSFMQVDHEGEIVFKGLKGLTVWSYILVALFIGLFRLEQIFRSFRDPLRYRLKYVLVGLGALACVSIAQAMHMLMVPVWSRDVVWAGGIAGWCSLLVVGIGVWRWKEQPTSQKIQFSHQALYTSLTLLLIVGYFVLVGMVATVIQYTGWETGESLGVVFLFLAGLGLVVFMLSRRARAEFREIVSRHFFSSKYDYREKWLEVADAFTSCQETRHVWNHYLEWLSRTFRTSRITIWKRFEVDGRYHQIRRERRRRRSDTQDQSSNQEPPPLSESHPMILLLKERQEPVLMKDGQGEANEWRTFLQVTHAQVCVPLVAVNGTLLGFCTLGKEGSDLEFDQDDLDLLRVMSHHVAMLMMQFQLVEERNANAKWEAVHRFSGFYLHDLKNFASSLSLVVQNAEQYGNDPDFHASVMRTVKKTSQGILTLMAKLSSQMKANGRPNGKPITAVDLNSVVREVLQGVNGSGCKPAFYPADRPPAVHIDHESLKQLILNLVLNARQALGGKGKIDISTAMAGSRAVLEVADTGPGMSSSQLEHLFEPFRSSKEHGLGVGLFQCKRLVEDHHGTIRVESRLGQGTKITVTFQAISADTV